MHRIASSPEASSVFPPQRPQKRCVACHPTICFARPAFLKKSLSTPKKKLRKSLKTMPSGASDPVSTAQQVSPSRSPISHLNVMSRLSSSANGTLTGPFSKTSSQSPLKANHSAWSANRVVQECGQVLGGVKGSAFCSVQDLLAAARPRRDHGPLPRLPHRRKQPSLPHTHRDLVVPFLVPEKSRHAATPRVDHLHVGSEPEQPLCRSRPHERLLVAVPVQENRVAFAQWKLHVQLQHRLFEEARGLRQLLDAPVFGEELAVVVAHGQDAAGLQADQGNAALEERHQQVQVTLRVLPGLIHESFGEHGPTAADHLRQAHPGARGGE